MQPGLEHGERNEVLIEHDNEPEEELMVHDSVVFEQEHHVNSVNGYETFTSLSVAPGVSESPEAVTERVARLLYDEFSYEVRGDGVRVVDMSADNTYEA